MKRSTVHRLALVTCMILAAILAVPAARGEFRSLQPVATPRQTWSHADIAVKETLPSAEVEKLANDARARAPQLAREAIQRLIQSWNQGDAARHLASGFVDRERFITSWDGQVPRDASVRLLAVEGVQPLDQDNRLEGTPPTRLHVQTRVSVRATTQVEFNDPKMGFQRREGRNEYIFLIKQRVPLTAGK